MESLLDRLGSSGPPGRRRIVGIAVGLGITVLAAAVVVSAMQSGGSSGQYPASATARPSVTAAALPTPTATPLLVHVVGAVRRPGLVSLPAGSRAIDAVTAAGGPLAGADESAVNLAARVVDGEQLVVPKQGAVAAPAASGATATAGAGAPISLSTATEAQLETLPRIGPAMAGRIIAWRTANGAFASVHDLLKVTGFGAKTLAGLQGLVTP